MTDAPEKTENDYKIENKNTTEKFLIKKELNMTWATHFPRPASRGQRSCDMQQQQEAVHYL